MEVGSLNRAGCLWRLALPTFALALAMSVLTTYAPLLLGEATSSASAIGLAIGAEGLFALFLPLLVGSLSDRTSTRLGRRLPYAAVAAPLLVLPLVVLPFASSYAQTFALVSLFYVGYFVYYPPYQALFAELVPATHQGRARRLPARHGGPLSRRARALERDRDLCGRRAGGPPARSRPPRAPRLRGGERALGALLHGPQDLHRPLRRQGSQRVRGDGLRGDRRRGGRVRGRLGRRRPPRRPGRSVPAPAGVALGLRRRPPPRSRPLLARPAGRRPANRRPGRSRRHDPALRAARAHDARRRRGRGNRPLQLLPRAGRLPRPDRRRSVARRARPTLPGDARLRCDVDRHRPPDPPLASAPETPRDSGRARRPASPRVRAGRSRAGLLVSRDRTFPAGPQRG